MADINMDGYEALGCLHDMFRQQVKKTPNKIAVVSDDGRQMTYQVCHLEGVNFERANIRVLLPLQLRLYISGCILLL